MHSLLENGWTSPVSKKTDRSRYNYEVGQQYKRQVIHQYSEGQDCCMLCGDSNFLHLTIDHINGGGKQHLKQLNVRGRSFYIYLIRNRYPQGYRVLCNNCQRKEAKRLGQFNRVSQPKSTLKKRERERKTYLKLKLDAIRAYGNACFYCGEQDTDVLSIDHANGNGASHRRAVSKGRSGTPFYRWLRHNDYPQDIGLRVACMSCQLEFNPTRRH